MKEYIVEAAAGETLTDAADNLTQKVNRLLDKGYVPVGGVSISLSEDQSSGRKYHYATQALTRETI